jgi:hypothetical protein
LVGPAFFVFSGGKALCIRGYGSPVGYMSLQLCRSDTLRNPIEGLRLLATKQSDFIQNVLYSGWEIRVIRCKEMRQLDTNCSKENLDMVLIILACKQDSLRN